jgi:hypothetical protein
MGRAGVCPQPGLSYTVEKMLHDPRKHRRRSIRLNGYEYTQPGAYFVTIYTQGSSPKARSD